MEIKDLLNLYYIDDEFKFGIDIVMNTLCPNCLYSVSNENGYFEITHWDKSNEVLKPLPQDIRDEYIRHRTIKEILDKYNIKEK